MRPCSPPAAKWPTAGRAPDLRHGLPELVCVGRIGPAVLWMIRRLPIRRRTWPWLCSPSSWRASWPWWPRVGVPRPRPPGGRALGAALLRDGAGTRTRSRRCRRSGSSWNSASQEPYGLVLEFLLVLGPGIRLDALQLSRDRERQAVRLEASLSEARLQALKMQLQPHFLYNTLNSISELAPRHRRGRPDARLSDMLRLVLEGAPTAGPAPEGDRAAGRLPGHPEDPPPGQAAADAGGGPGNPDRARCPT